LLKSVLFLCQAAFNKVALFGSQIRSQNLSVSRDVRSPSKLLRGLLVQYHSIALLLQPYNKKWKHQDKLGQALRTIPLRMKT
jgi:hypothetical protein